METKLAKWYEQAQNPGIFGSFESEPEPAEKKLEAGAVKIVCSGSLW